MSKKRPKGFLGKINLNDLPDSERIIPTNDNILEPSTALINSTELKDLEVIQELGAGNGGTVFKVKHRNGGYMALKTIQVDAKASVQKQILRELQILKNCNSPFIVGYYGAFLEEGEISVCMEYMDCGALDGILGKFQRLPLEIVGKVSFAVLSGLVYLFETHRIIHRGILYFIIQDVKPSNILINANGEIKIADFGVSGELLNSLANTFVGTSAYMSPERIQGLKYSVQCDVWSLGLTVVELVTGRFPFPSNERQFSVFELLEFIVKEPIPVPPPGQFPPEFDAFVSRCLIKNHDDRPTPLELLSDPFILVSHSISIDLVSWARSLIK